MGKPRSDRRLPRTGLRLVHRARISPAKTAVLVAMLVAAAGLEAVGSAGVEMVAVSGVVAEKEVGGWVVAEKEVGGLAESLAKVVVGLEAGLRVAEEWAAAGMAAAKLVAATTVPEEVEMVAEAMEVEAMVVEVPEVEVLAVALAAGAAAKVVGADRCSSLYSHKAQTIQDER